MMGFETRSAASFAATLALLAGAAGQLSAQDATVPTPESVFGFPVGAEEQLFDYGQSIAYFEALAEASDRVEVIDVGWTSFGRTWKAVLISAPDNLQNLERHRQISQRIAHPDGLTDEQARELAREGRAIVDISGGLHASEIAGSQHTPQLAYELLAHADEPDYAEILDNVILFLWPTINPDGQDIVVDWCRADYAGEDPDRMELYQKYIGHDNNRDSYMLNVVESRVIQRVWREWEPHIIYVHHQTSPEPTRIWLPPFADPVGLHAPPITAREINVIGMTIAQELEARGQPGAVHALSTYDAWYPGYIDYMPVYHNIPAFWTETQGGSCATTKPARDPQDFSAAYRDLVPRALYLSPWEGDAWSLRDAVDYMVTASYATLKYAAKFKEDLLFNRYQAGRNTIQKYRSQPPYGYVIPQRQHDRVAPVELLRRIAFMGVRVLQAERDVVHEGLRVPAGSWVIPLDQEYGELVRTLFEAQVYPDMGDDTPYDAAGWTLPYQMGVEVLALPAPVTPAFRATLRDVEGEPVDWRTAPDAPFTTNAAAAGIAPAPGVINGQGDVLALDPAQNNSFRLINRGIAEGAEVRFESGDGALADGPVAAGGVGSVRGGDGAFAGTARYLVAGVDPAAAQSWAEELWVEAEWVPQARWAGARPAGTRIALYKGRPGDMAQGWAEWLLDTFEFEYTLIGPAELAAGGLASRFDAIFFASQSIGAAGGRGGRRGGGGGQAGGGGRGGRGAGGQAAEPDPIPALDAFVTAGGTALFWNRGALSAISALDLPVANVVDGLARSEYFTGGSIMRATMLRGHQVTAGMPGVADVFVDGSPVFQILDGFRGTVLATYPGGETPLRSGFLTGAENMLGRAAALDVEHGAGRVVLMAFEPMWRGQSTGTFRMVFNALLLGR